MQFELFWITSRTFLQVGLTSSFSYTWEDIAINLIRNIIIIQKLWQSWNEWNITTQKSRYQFYEQITGEIPRYQQDSIPLPTGFHSLGPRFRQASCPKSYLKASAASYQEGVQLVSQRARFRHGRMVPRFLIDSFQGKCHKAPSGETESAECNTNFIF